MKTLKLFLTLSLLFSIVGCTKSEQALRSTIAMEESAKNYQRNVEKLVESLINDFKTTAQKKADELFDNAVKSITQPDGSIHAGNHQVLMNQKIRHYQEAEELSISLRAKLIAANRDIDNLLQYSKALQEYFKQKTELAVMLNQSSDQLIKTLDGLIKKK